MNYKEKEIKQGIKFHTIDTNKFKTNLMAVFLTTKLTRENVTKNALISLLLRRGSQKMKTQEKISKQMENLYGAIFECGLDKTGDNQVIKLYIETINDKYLPQSGENMLKTAMDNLLELAFNPYVENDGFSKEYLNQEKNTIKQLIEARTDNKARYSQERCIEEMYKNENYSLFKFGYVDDLENIDEKSLYKYYKELIQDCKIDIFVSGNIDENVNDIVEKNENIQKLKERQANYAEPVIVKKVQNEEKIVTESLDVAQGKLVLGLDIDIDNDDEKYDILAYNAILGGTATSKLFQNVREKASLAYSAGSLYIKNKNSIVIRSGIEKKNYEKALEIIEKQIDDMKQGNFDETDMKNAKQLIVASFRSMEDEQDSTISYYFGKEMEQENADIATYISQIENVTKEQIVKVAQNVTINTIYFLSK